MPPPDPTRSAQQRHAGGERPPGGAQPAGGAHRPTGGEATAGGSQGPKIRLRGLVKSFGAKRVLDGVDLDVAAGESLVVIGASGTGKSVTLKHIIGLMRPDSGTVVVDGVAIEKLGNREITEFRRRFGMAFQEGALFDSINVFDNVAFPLRRLSHKSAPGIRALAYTRLPLLPPAAHSTH